MRTTVLRLMLWTACVIGAISLQAQVSPWSSGTYTYDGAGNIKAVGTDYYVYDEAGRLVKGSADKQRSGGDSYQTYTYDPFGNRLMVQTTGTSCVNGCGVPSTVDAFNHLTNHGATYDGAGNIQHLDNFTYAYDGAGMLSKTSVVAAGYDVQYIYDAGDERIAVYTGGGQWRFTIRDLDQKVIREVTASQSSGGTTWTWSRDHVFRDGLLLASVLPGTTRNYHLDHLGSPRLVTDENHHKIGVHTYYPFGDELSLGLQEPVAPDALKFTGHERDEGLYGLSLDYMHARYYGPGLGRFLSVDPVMGDPHSPQSWNRYSYVMNNPLTYTDPTGKILSLIGTDDLKRQAERIANQSLFGQQMKVDGNGTTTLVSNGVQGPPTEGQAAAASNLKEIIQNPATTTVNLASGSSSVLVGDFKSATIDLADMSTLGTGSGFSAGAAFGHEVREQFQGQVMHTPDPAGSPAGYGSHLIARGAESRITGYSLVGEGRVLQMFGPKSFDLERTATRGSSSVTIILHVRDLNIQGVDRP